MGLGVWRRGVTAGSGLERLASSNKSPPSCPFAGRKLGWGEGERDTYKDLPVLGRKGDAGACNTPAASFSPWETT